MIVEVKVKRYANTSAANRDAKRMAAEGWEPQGMAGGGTRLSLGKGIVNKGVASAALGPLGLFASSRVQQPVTITWTRMPEAAAAVQRRKQEAAAIVAKRRTEAAQRRAAAATARREASAEKRAAKQQNAMAKQATKQETAVAREAAKREAALTKQVGKQECAMAKQQAAIAKEAQIASTHRIPEPPPGWHSDPYGQARLRWWDGNQWTGHTSA